MSRPTTRSRYASGGKSVRPFRERCREEALAFLEAIDGIPEEPLRRSYAVTLLVRLMTLAFLEERRGMRDESSRRPESGPERLLQHLATSQRRGRDRFAADVLLPLFDLDRRAKPAQGESACPSLRARAGLFRRHPAEERFGGAIAIPDAAFERLFRFFAEYRWSGDERNPGFRETVRGANDEVHPDDMGNLVAAAIARKPSGVYYTAPDIAAHVAANTLVPLLIDRARAIRPASFDESSPVWDLLRDYPDRYLPGAPIADDAGIPWTADPAVSPWAIDDVYIVAAENASLMAPDPEPPSSSPETKFTHFSPEWIKSIRHRLASGEVRSVNDMVTLNLNLRRFAIDVVRRRDDSGAADAIREALRGVILLDPTCGAGAFLVASTDLLAAICRTGQEEGTANREIGPFLSQCLHGIDMMEEAVEACRARLYLLGTARGWIEEEKDHGGPPPNSADFVSNVRVGDVLGEDGWTGILPLVAGEDGVDAILGNPPYVERRVVNESTVTVTVDYLDDPTDDTLSGLRRIDRTARCGNLYPPVVERSLRILKPGGRLGMVLPMGAGCSDRMAPLRSVIFEKCDRTWWSHFAIRPQSLFPGVAQRASILLARRNGDDTPDPGISFDPPSMPAAGEAQRCMPGARSDTPRRTAHHSTNYLHWTAAERPSLLTRIRHADVTRWIGRDGVVPKISTPLEARILEAIEGSKVATSAGFTGFSAPSPDPLYIHDSGESYWTKALWERPAAFRNGIPVDPAQWFSFAVPPGEKPFLYLLLNASLLYWLWTVWTDCRHMTRGFIKRLPLPPDRAVDPSLVDALRMAQAEHATFREKHPGYRSVEIAVRAYKPLLDRIDAMLALKYNLSPKELNFIIQYERRYRGC